MARVVDTLKQCVLFSNSNDSDIGAISRLAVSRVVEEKETLAVSGEKATSFYIIESGMFLLDQDDGKSMVLDRCGDFAGLDILSRQGIYCANLTALTSGTVLTIKRNDFLDIIQDASPHADQIMQAWNQFLTHEIPYFQHSDDTELLDYQY